MRSPGYPERHLDPDDRARRLGEGAGDRVRLRHVAGSEQRGARAKEREQIGEQRPEPAVRHAARDVVHGAAGELAVFSSDAEVDAGDRLGVFRRHAERRRHPHPEHGSGTTDQDRRGDTADVAVADGRRQRRRQGLKLRDGAVARPGRRAGKCPGHDHPEGGGEAADLHHPGHHRDEPTDDDEHERHRERLPDEVVQREDAVGHAHHNIA